MDTNPIPWMSQLPQTRCRSDEALRICNVLEDLLHATEANEALSCFLLDKTNWEWIPPRDDTGLGSVMV